MGCSQRLASCLRHSARTDILFRTFFVLFLDDIVLFLDYLVLFPYFDALFTYFLFTCSYFFSTFPAFCCTFSSHFRTFSLFFPYSLQNRKYILKKSKIQNKNLLARAIHREQFLVTMLLRLLCCFYAAPAVAVLLLCGRYMVAMLLLCGCYAVAMWLLCGCYAVAMRLLCGCCFITLSVLFSFFPLFFAKLKYFKSSKKNCWHVQFIENIFLLQCCYGCCAVAYLIFVTGATGIPV